ncbi:MAG: redoxin domain-containing protein [Acidimicrobiales bacterium]|nr:redoxin domain-containing protein [Acidimicrobiales bacterium]
MHDGDEVPEFTATDQHGNRVTVGELVAGGPVVLFVHPRATTPVCTAESCYFRDLAGEPAAR